MSNLSIVKKTNIYTLDSLVKGMQIEVQLFIVVAVVVLTYLMILMIGVHVAKLD
jgi:hypothetical protein